jgi:mRNA interferase MazF
VTLDKLRPAVVLTRAEVAAVRRQVTVAPITSRIRGLSVEVLVGKGQGLDHESVVNVDNVQTVPSTAVGPFIGVLSPVQEHLLARAVRYAFDLEEA